MTAIRKQYVKRGFTLVEILIVVIILGILAAIVIPQFTNASTEARGSNVRSQLQTLRSQIELYKLQHKDEAPDLVGSSWGVFTSKTDIDGAIGTGVTHIYGPYMQTPPVNPLSGFSVIAAGDETTTGATDTGWIYELATGRIWATNGKLPGDGMFVE